ncbi:LacI family DNA-binding transcriptional regulator [Haematobacter genomosp. 1]|uniref:LacI family transcriptional regulator n=1 Tax=Haematobacter genomosp. 1 TaxID=366618 RepID=A0A212ABH3_9RHOB|nr:LacI family DNA-binding transcriptional regulator [Haematobacter genomosp. 1]OWJ77923.1 LacI family transcriptional regulator [Haematobacter genomosp. 1]
MSRERPRIGDVARIAGVSTATVSRALSNPALVSAETRAAVMDAVEATGYRLNQAARNLRHRRTGAIVALVPNLANPFFSQILSGIASVLGPAGYNLLIVDTWTAGADRLRDCAEPSLADGLIVLDGTLPAEIVTGRLPVVEACEWINGLAAPRVKIDNRAAAGLAIDHLVDLGHRRIGHVAGPPESVLSVARLAGVRDRLAMRGLSLAEDALYAGDFSLDSGRRAALSWIAQPADLRPTGLFLASDAMACGFMAEVQRHGIRVPEQVSIIGFDDIELVSHVSPPLTTIRQPRTALGRMAAERLLHQLGGAEEAESDTILPVELVIRSSATVFAG